MGVMSKGDGWVVCAQIVADDEPGARCGTFHRPSQKATSPRSNSRLRMV